MLGDTRTAPARRGATRGSASPSSPRCSESRSTPTRQAADLALGHQQQVEIIKALWRGSRVLILDEPTSMLTPQGVAELAKVLARLKEQGQAVIFITHKLHEALSLGDRDLDPPPGAARRGRSTVRARIDGPRGAAGRDRPDHVRRGGPGGRRRRRAPRRAAARRRRPSQSRVESDVVLELRDVGRRGENRDGDRGRVAPAAAGRDSRRGRRRRERPAGAGRGHRRPATGASHGEILLFGGRSPG